MSFTWPPNFPRIPDEDWTRQSLGELALKYDTVETHGWYANLARTVEQLEQTLADGDVLVDYSGGTGILLDRLLARIGAREVGVVIADSSPKFLRLALEKHREEVRAAFRLIRYLKDDGRLQLLDEALSVEDLGRSVDAIASTNAVHLYHDLPATLASWRRVVRTGGRAFVQSGNIRNPAAAPDEWIIDETVDAIHHEAVQLARSDDRWEAHRAALDDPARMAAHEKLRHKFFLPVRPLAHYEDAMTGAGFRVLAVETRTIEARVDEWFEFLGAYHEGVLGWVGGSRRVEGEDPSDDAVRDRLALMRLAMDRIFRGRATFPCCWTYLTAEAT